MEKKVQVKSGHPSEPIPRSQWICISDTDADVSNKQSQVIFANWHQHEPLEEVVVSDMNEDVEGGLNIGVDTVIDLDHVVEEIEATDTELAAMETRHCPGQYGHASVSQTTLLEVSTSQQDHSSASENLDSSGVSLNCCPLDCGEKIGSETQLRRHLQRSHSLAMKKEVAQFRSMGSFLAWKEARERESCRRYVVRETRSTWRRFACSRSGNPSGHERPSRWKRLGVFCPAYIRTKTAPDGSVKARFCLMHTCQTPDNSALGSERDIAKAYRHLELMERIVQRECGRSRAPPGAAASQQRAAGSAVPAGLAGDWGPAGDEAGAPQQTVPTDAHLKESSEFQEGTEDLAGAAAAQETAETLTADCAPPANHAATAAGSLAGQPRRKRPRTSQARRARSAARAWRCRPPAAQHGSRQRRSDPTDDAGGLNDSSTSSLKTRAKTALLRLLATVDGATSAETERLLTDVERLITEHDRPRRRGVAGAGSRTVHKSESTSKGKLGPSLSAPSASERSTCAPVCGDVGHQRDAVLDHAYVHDSCRQENGNVTQEVIIQHQGTIKEGNGMQLENSMFMTQSSANHFSNISNDSHVVKVGPTTSGIQQRPQVNTTSSFASNNRGRVKETQVVIVAAKLP